MKSGWSHATDIAWLENASMGMVSCAPLSSVETIAGISVSNADAYLDWLRFLAERISTYIDANHINGPSARMHHRILRRFVRHCLRFADFELLNGGTQGSLKVIRDAYIRAVRLCGLKRRAK